MPIKVLVNGAFGRMGQITIQAITNHPQLTLVGQTGKEYDLAKSIKDSEAQVVVDFTQPDVVFANTKTIINAGAYPVIGTSGLTREQVSSLQQLCKEKKHGGIIVPNFSLGAVLMMKYAKEIAKYIPNVEIIEMHHPAKIDSPSGTALRTADMLMEANPNLNASLAFSKDNIPPARGTLHGQIPIHALRLPGFLAHQRIIFGDAGETLTLCHDSIDRACFMPGVCLACEKVVGLDRLAYGLEEIL